MVCLVLEKGQDGKLRGAGETSDRQYQKIKQRMALLDVGDTVKAEFKFPRSPGHHRAFFRMLGLIFDRQEQFDNADKLRQWLTVGAGYCDFMPGPTGRMVAIPQSIAYEKMEEAEFSNFHQSVRDFLWTPHARRFLWPHLSEEQQYETLDQLFLEVN